MRSWMNRSARPAERLPDRILRPAVEGMEGRLLLSSTSLLVRSGVWRPGAFVTSPTSGRGDLKGSSTLAARQVIATPGSSPFYGAWIRFGHHVLAAPRFDPFTFESIRQG